jgi:hypothetical protein
MSAVGRSIACDDANDLHQLRHGRHGTPVVQKHTWALMVLNRLDA